MNVQLRSSFDSSPVSSSDPKDFNRASTGENVFLRLSGEEVHSPEGHRPLDEHEFSMGLSPVGLSPVHTSSDSDEENDSSIDETPPLVTFNVNGSYFHFRDPLLLKQRGYDVDSETLFMRGQILDEDCLATWSWLLESLPTKDIQKGLETNQPIKITWMDKELNVQITCNDKANEALLKEIQKASSLIKDLQAGKTIAADNTKKLETREIPDEDIANEYENTVYLSAIAL